MATETRNEVLNLMNKKDLIEKEIKELGSILTQVIMTIQFYICQISIPIFILEWCWYERSVGRF